MSFKIDGTEFDANGQWTHQVVPGGPQMRQVFQFPGIAMRYVGKGPLMPPSLVITGWLNATGSDLATALYALHLAIYNVSQYAADNLVHSVEINGAVYPQCECVSVAPIGGTSMAPPGNNSEMLGGVEQIAAAAGSVAVRRPIQWHWTQLVWAPASGGS